MTAPTPVGTVRRLQAMAADGMRWPEVAEAVGLSRSAVQAIATGTYGVTPTAAAKVAEGYEQTSGWRRVPETKIARREWAGSDQWAGLDIDDEHAAPWPLDTIPDEVLVRRVLAGLVPFAAVRYRVDRREVVQRMAAAGLPVSTITSRLGCTSEAVDDLLASPAVARVGREPVLVGDGERAA